MSTKDHRVEENVLDLVSFSLEDPKKNNDELVVLHGNNFSPNQMM